MNKKIDEKIKEYLREPNKKEELLKLLDKIEEESEKNKTYIDKLHDKIFKEIMLDKEEVARFIYINYNIFLKPNELELCNTEFRTRNNKVLEVDILYKIKEKQIFFLIEHQTKSDRYMAYRVLNYEIEIVNRYRTITGENKPTPRRRRRCCPPWRQTSQSWLSGKVRRWPTLCSSRNARRYWPAPRRKDL